MTRDDRWSTNPASPARAHPAPTGRRFAMRDIVAIFAGGAAIAGLGVAAWRSGEDHQGVMLRSGAGSASGEADMAPIDGNWDGASGGTAAPGGSTQVSGPTPAGPPDPALVAQTPAEHARQTQAFQQIMTPRLQNGRVTGYTVGDGALPPLLARAGVEAGDVVVFVNGLGLQSDAMVAELSQEMAGSRLAEFVVERGGSTRTVSVKLRD